MTADALQPEYSLPFYWMYRDGENFLVMNPRIYANTNAKVTGALFLGIVEIWLDFQFDVLKGSPLEYQALWSLDRKGNYCHSLGAYMDIFDFEINFTWKALECMLGYVGYQAGGIQRGSSSSTADVRGITYDATKDMMGPCEWRAYEQQLPIYKASFLKRGDMAYDYVPWVCNFYDENPYEKINANATEIDEKIRNPDG